ncbi:4293_t:CDS:2, partial [Gigaspora rosea]
MVKNWYELLIASDPNHRTAICRNNKSWLVREILYPLQILDLHQTLIPINMKNNTFNSNTSYYKYQLTKNSNAIWIPLLPGFCDNANLQYIQLLVSQQYPNLFEIDKKLNNVLHKETLLKNNLETQALMVDYNNIKNELTNAKRTIKRLNQKIIELSNSQM